MSRKTEGRVLFAMVIGALCLIDCVVLVGRHAVDQCWLPSYEMPSFTVNRGSPTLIEKE